MSTSLPDVFWRSLLPQSARFCYKYIRGHFTLYRWVFYDGFRWLTPARQHERAMIAFVSRGRSTMPDDAPQPALPRLNLSEAQESDATQPGTPSTLAERRFNFAAFWMSDLDGHAAPGQQMQVDDDRQGIQMQRGG
jgi:hypothetical protein